MLVYRSYLNTDEKSIELGGGTFFLFPMLVAKIIVYIYAVNLIIFGLYY